MVLKVAPSPKGDNQKLHLHQREIIKRCVPVPKGDNQKLHPQQREIIKSFNLTKGRSL
jgi:hypothetical protein